ncbi:MAG: hypothetical protein JNL74_18455 [Fibrobacteres bacterium]|nr:hypothetical protein [Fibrobacterota bacterium]
MKITKLPILALLTLISGCTIFDEENLTGSKFASANDEPRQNYTVYSDNLPQAVLDTALSVLDTARWNSKGVCRTGVFDNDTFYAFLGFKADAVPPALDSLNGRFATDEMREAYGIDSVKIDFYVVNGSEPSRDTVGKNSVQLLSYRRNGSGISGEPISLGSYNLTQAGIVAPADSGFISLSIRRKDSAYKYIVDSMLCNRTTDSVSVPLAILQNSAGMLLSLNPSKPPVLRYYGKSIKRTRVVTPGSLDSEYGEIVRDSFIISARIMKTAALTESKHSTLLNTLPSVSTYEVMKAKNGSLSDFGRYKAQFDISLDSLFKGIGLDTVVMLNGNARFFTVAGYDSSISEAKQSLDFLVACHLLDSAGNKITVKGSGLYAISDTVAKYSAFEPWKDTSFEISINKHVVSLTDPAFRLAKTLRFTVSAADRMERSNLDRMARVVFRKKVAVDFTYEKR